MNNIAESADPVRVNGFLAAFPDGGFGTSEFFTAARCRVGFALHDMPLKELALLLYLYFVNGLKLIPTVLHEIHP